MKKILASHKYHWTQKQFLISMMVGMVLLAGSLVVDKYTSDFAVRKASNPVNDLILDNIRTYDVDIILNQGVIIGLSILAFALIYEPKRLPFAIKSIALFIFIRSIFISLTHLGPPFEYGVLDPNDPMFYLSDGRDYFFSGHTGVPFLFALIFWDHKSFRVVGLAITIMLASAVILGHFHYSIDVFAAFFMTYTIFHIAQFLFPNDYKRTQL